MRRVRQWMEDHLLQLANTKTEILVLSGKKTETILPMQVGQTVITTTSNVKYLGVTLDTKLTFWPHILRVTDKASKVTSALSGLMANVPGPKSYKRRLLMTTVKSILLYGAEI